MQFSRDPCHDRCHGLMMLETFSTLPIDELKCKVPDFLDVTQEVTGDPAFSMFNLALKSEWTAKDFCRRLVLEVHVINIVMMSLQYLCIDLFVID